MKFHPIQTLIDVLKWYLLEDLGKVWVDLPRIILVCRNPVTPKGSNYGKLYGGTYTSTAAAA